MKFQIESQTFQPINLKITFETREDFINFYNKLEYGFQNEGRYNTKNSEILNLLSTLDKIFNKI